MYGCGGFTVPDSYSVQQYRLCKGSVEDSSGQKDLSIVLDNLNTSQQCMCVMKTSCMVGCNRKNVDSRLMEVIFFFSSSVAICSSIAGVLCPALGSQRKKDVFHRDSSGFVQSGEEKL